MKKMNFKELEIPTGISKKNRIKGDAREMFANAVYVNRHGIAAHALALKIYESDGELEITEQEEEIIRTAASIHCTPAFIDAVNEQLDRKEP